MRVRLYQINDPKVAFCSYDYVVRVNGRIRHTDYECVWDGEADIKRLTDLWTLFNVSMPERRFRALSISDVVQLYGSKVEYYFADVGGFRKIDFLFSGREITD